jgi:hypothetical protein
MGVSRSSTGSSWLPRPCLSDGVEAPAACLDDGPGADVVLIAERQDLVDAGGAGDDAAGQGSAESAWHLTGVLDRRRVPGGGGGQDAYFITRSPRRGSAASICLRALPRTVLYALTIAGRLELPRIVSVTESSASETSSPRLDR